MKTTALLGAIRESSTEELVARLGRLQEELFQNRLKRSLNQLENTSLIRSARREIARVKTVIEGRLSGHEEQADKSVEAKPKAAKPAAKKKVAKKAKPAAKKPAGKAAAKKKTTAKPAKKSKGK